MEKETCGGYHAIISILIVVVIIQFFWIYLIKSEEKQLTKKELEEAKIYCNTIDKKVYLFNNLTWFWCE